MSAIELVSHGGGTQTTAMLVLAAQGKIDVGLFIFANVGDDSENQETLDYHRDVSVPFAAKHGIDLREIRRVHKRGAQKGEAFDTLLAYTTGPNRTIPIPVYMPGGAPGTRQCTERWKIGPVADVAKAMGATVENPADIALGITVDEIERAHPGIDVRLPWCRKVYPLLDLGLKRADCLRIVADAGLPQPPKSACWFCPYTSHEVWRQRKRNQPEVFAQAVTLDRRIREKRETLGRDGAFLHPSCKPLEDAVEDQGALFEGDDCESGWCMT